MAHKTASGFPPINLSNGYVLQKIMRGCTTCPECGEKTNWTGHLNKSNGMYHISVRGRRFSVRRLVLELNGKKLRPGSKVITRCDNHRCINLELLEQVDMRHIIAEAMAAGTMHTLAARKKIAEKRRAACGVITQEQAREIRMSDLPSNAEAAKHGITASYVRAIRAGIARKDYAATPFSGLGARS